MEYGIGLLSLLFLQVYSYFTAYYITRTVVEEKMQGKAYSLNKLMYLVALYLISVGSFTLVALGMYRPVYLFAGLVVLVSVGTRFTK